MQELNLNFPISDSRGYPTAYFIRFLQERGILTEDDHTLLVQLLAKNITSSTTGLTVTNGAFADAGNIVLSATISTLLDGISSTHGSVLYRDTATWAALGPGTSGQVLQTNGAAADPSWVTPSSGSGSAWHLLDASGATITSGATWTWASNVANVDVINLGSYTDLMVVARGLTSSSSGNRNILVSVDNGSSFYSSSGDYISITEAGVEANASAMLIHDTASTSARGLTGYILGSGVTGGQKLGLGPGTGANRQRVFVASTSPVNALRLVPGGGGNLTAGSLYVYGR